MASCGPDDAVTMEGERRRGWGEPWVQNTGPGARHEVESGLREVTPTLGLCHDDITAYLVHWVLKTVRCINLWLIKW